jgi:histidyl-tRNA synthetase
MTKGRFREFFQCDFDIAGSYTSMIPDAEVISVIVEILSELKIGSFVVKINHRSFLDAIVELSGCEKRKFKSICSSVDKLDKEDWEKVKEELIHMKGLTEEQADKLGVFVKFKGKPFKMLKELEDAGVFKDSELGLSTMKEMS